MYIAKGRSDKIKGVERMKQTDWLGVSLKRILELRD